MSTHSREIIFVLLAVLVEQQAQRVQPHPHKIDLIIGIVPNPFFEKIFFFYPLYRESETG